jgi:hypothetical protein
LQSSSSSDKIGIEVRMILIIDQTPSRKLTPHKENGKVHQ